MQIPFSVIICAGGSSVRMGFDKLSYKLNGVPVLARTAMLFTALPEVQRIAVAVSEARFDELSAILPRDGRITVCSGGATRQQSAAQALAALGCATEELVAVHDGARPFVSTEEIRAVVGAAADSGAALLARPLKEALHRAENGYTVGAEDRSAFVLAQTPQVFRAGLLKKMYFQPDSSQARDEAELAACLGVRCSVVSGSARNVKLTTPEDIAMLSAPQQESIRVGHGYDVHRLTADRRLVLGGVDIPFEKGLLGHSDADVLTHAVMDALLGAAALGDIGKLFPDSAAEFEGISSLKLLCRVRAALESVGAQVRNIDATAVCQRPKLAPHIDAMRQNIASALGIPVSAVSVKATTEERLGFTGSGEGIAAHAVALIDMR